MKNKHEEIEKLLNDHQTRYNMMQENDRWTSAGMINVRLAVLLIMSFASVVFFGC